jgi:hypothetical protein
VKLFYFHRKFCCHERERTENLVKETLETHFSEELKNGRLTWQVVDLSVKENQHYLIDYYFMYNTAMIVEKFGNDVRLKSLKKIYGSGEDREGAMEFIRFGIEQFSKSGGDYQIAVS